MMARLAEIDSRIDALPDGGEGAQVTPEFVLHWMLQVPALALSAAALLVAGAA